MPRRYIVAYDFLFLPTFTWLSANFRYGKFAYRGSCKRKKFWLAVLLNVNQSKKVGGRRSVEELYQALFFVSPVPPECFTERNENRAWSHAGYSGENGQIFRSHLFKNPGIYIYIPGSKGSFFQEAPKLRKKFNGDLCLHSYLRRTVPTKTSKLRVTTCRGAYVEQLNPSP